VQKFIEYHPNLNLVIVKENKRTGKSHALNLGLERSTGEVIIVSDADCFWSPDILNKALPYLADPTVGAIAGEEKLLNTNQSWVTRTEQVYREKMSQIRVGESKVHSTILFEGGFGAYKRLMLDKFDSEIVDDSGTALNVVQKGARAIIVPEATFFTCFPDSWRGKITIKTRRASHLLQIWIKCLKLFLRRRLLLPKRIALPEAFLHILNPFIFLLLTFATFLLLLQYPILLPFFLVPFLIPKSRAYLVEVIQDNFIVLLASVALAIGKNSVVWRKAEESRTLVDIEALKEENLI